MGSIRRKWDLHGTLFISTLRMCFVVEPTENKKLVDPLPPYFRGLHTLLVKYLTFMHASPHPVAAGSGRCLANSRFSTSTRTTYPSPSSCENTPHLNT